MHESLTTVAGLSLYEALAEKIAFLVEEGTYRPGERVPSIRSLSQQFRVSINTVKEAYRLLEDRRVIEARPQSGFFVCARYPEAVSTPMVSPPDISPVTVSTGELTARVMRDTLDPTLIQFGCAIPNPELLPIDRLNRMLAGEVRRLRTQSIAYAIPPGNPRLRKQISRRLVMSGCAVRPDEVVITDGCTEAVALALRSLCQAGDAIAAASPDYFNFLQLIESLGLRALEIPTDPGEGISLEALSYALEHNQVKACVVISNFNNPLGSVMSDERKQQLVELLAARDIPLIEDDIYGDLAHDGHRPSVAKAYDRDGRVLLCSSFSKTLAPGYRVGWIAPGRYRESIERLKMVSTIASAAPTQMAIAEFLANGGYDHHLRTIRRVYASKVAQMSDAIGRYFPEGTRISRPRGGFSLWVEMPQGVDAVRLYREAHAAGITLAPGNLFSVSGKYRNCVRLNAAFWSEREVRAIEKLGKLAGALPG